MKQNKQVRQSGDTSDMLRAVFPFGRIVLSLSFIAVLTKVFGFAEKVIIAHYFGTSDKADVYFASMGIVLSIVWLVRELIYPSFLPVFSESLSKSSASTELGRGSSSAARLFSKVFLLTGGLLGIMAMCLFIFSNGVTALLVPGFSGSKQHLTSDLLKALAPGVLFFGLSMVTYTTLNARRNFLKAAIPRAGFKLFIVAGLLVLLPFMGIYALALLVSLGAFGCLAIQLYFVPERRFLFRAGGKRHQDEYFKKVLFLMGPLAIGVVFSHISLLVDNLLASTLPQGNLSFLGYSKKIIDAILLIGPVALVTVVYSQLSHFASQKQYEDFTILLRKAFRMLLYLSVPAGCILIGLRVPVIRFLFERGKFDAESTIGTSRAFMIYCFGLTTFSLEALLVYSFYALSNTKTPIKWGILCGVIDVALAVVLMKPFGCLGIAGAYVISKTIKIVILAGILRKKTAGVFGPRIGGFLVKLAFNSAAVWMITKALLAVANPDGFVLCTLADLLLPAAGASAGFILLSYLLKLEELGMIISLLRYKKAALKGFSGEAK